LFAAPETIWPEIWPAAHNRELWLTPPDGYAHVGRVVRQVAEQSPDYRATVKQQISPVLTDETKSVGLWPKNRTCL
jgi:hypothetical protein